MKHYFLVISILVFTLSCSQQSNNTATPILPDGKEISEARFFNNTIYLDLITDHQDTLTFYTDTGGGKLMYPEVVDWLNIRIDSIESNGNWFESIDLAPIFSKYGIPEPLGKQFLFRQEKSGDYYNAGILGGYWFDQKIWKFDYLNEKLFILDSINWESLPKENTIELGFLEDEEGNHVTHFPRVPIVVEEDTIEVLFDTGAHMILSKEAQPEFAGEKNVASSFIIESIFNQWKTEHPDWTIVEKGDSLIGEDIIQVPEVSLGGYVVGPVWFAKRKDTNFTQFMSRFMDEVIEGAIGGSCLQYYDNILADYKNEKAFFYRNTAAKDGNK